MIRGVRILCAAVLMVGVVKASGSDSWSEEKGKHFIVYHQGTAAKASEVVKAAERLYVSITKSLGVKRYDNFWLWDDRAKIY